MRGGNFGIGSRTNCNCANHASPSVRRPSVRPTVHRISPLLASLLSPPSQSTLCPLPRLLQRAQILRGFPMPADVEGDTYLPTRLMPA